MRDYRFWELVLNPALIASLGAMASSQAFKTLKPIAAGKAPDLRKFVDYGGWPSSHTAFIAACAASIGILEGFRSSAFALAGVLASMLIYDILKMRRVVDLDGREIDRLLVAARLERGEKPPQFKGHSPGEVVAGIAWGCAWAAATCAVWP